MIKEVALLLTNESTGFSWLESSRRIRFRTKCFDSIRDRSCLSRSIPILTNRLRFFLFKLRTHQPILHMSSYPARSDILSRLFISFRRWTKSSCCLFFSSLMRLSDIVIFGFLNFRISGFVNYKSGPGHQVAGYANANE